jgi:hypothetical protein
MIVVDGEAGRTFTTLELGCAEGSNENPPPTKFI